MNQPYPEFKSGNAAFVDALNQVVEYARRHGVNPGGRPGWNETPDGWMPPFQGGGGNGSSRRIWDIEVVDAEAGTIKLEVPGKVRISDDVDETGLIAIASIGATIAMAAGDYLVLEWDATTSTPVCTLKVLDTWSGFPFAYTTADSGDHKIFQKGYTPLWVAKAAEDVPTPVAGLHVVLNAEVTLERLAPDAHFEVINYLVEIASGQMVDVDRLIPGCGAG